MNKYIAGIIAVAFIFPSAAACRKAMGEPPGVSVGHAPRGHHLPLYVADRKNAYSKEHGDIYFRQITSRRQYRLIVNGGSVAKIAIDSSVGKLRDGRLTGQVKEAHQAGRLGEENRDLDFCNCVGRRM